MAGTDSAREAHIKTCKAGTDTARQTLVEDVEALGSPLSAGRWFMERKIVGRAAGRSSQELEALLKQISILLGSFASLERDAEYNKKEAEMEWRDLAS